MSIRTMTTRYEIVIQDWHPATKNELARSVRSKIRLKKQDRGMVWLACRDVPRATGKRRVSVRFVYGPGERMRDVDAYDHSLFDALKQGGLIRNDSPLWLERGPWRFERGEQRGTVILLEELLAGNECPVCGGTGGGEEGWLQCRACGGTGYF